MEFTTNDYKETIALGKKLGLLAKPNMIYCMSGDLGAGKTTMTKGIALGLDIDATITSPTFTIMKNYKGRMPLYHLDCYRLEGVNQDLGFEEYLDDDGLAVIEWSQHIEQLIDHCLYIDIAYIEEHKRTITLRANGVIYEELLEELQ